MLFLILLFSFLWKIIGTIGGLTTGPTPLAYVIMVPWGDETGPPLILSFDREIYLSPLPARIYLRGVDHWLEDLGSQNSTYVNGEHVTTPLKLSQAALIHVGNAVVVYHRPPNSPMGKG